MSVDHGHQLLSLGNAAVVLGQIGQMLEEVGHHVAGGGGGILDHVVGGNGQVEIVAQRGQIVLHQLQNFGMGVLGSDHGQFFTGKGSGQGKNQHQGQDSGKQLFHRGFSFRNQRFLWSRPRVNRVPKTVMICTSTTSSRLAEYMMSNLRTFKPLVMARAPKPPPPAALASAV